MKSYRSWLDSAQMTAAAFIGQGRLKRQQLHWRSHAICKLSRSYARSSNGNSIHSHHPGRNEHHLQSKSNHIGPDCLGTLRVLVVKVEVMVGVVKGRVLDHGKSVELVLEQHCQRP